MILVPLVNALVGVAQRWWSARVGEGIIFDLRRELFDHLQRMSLRFVSVAAALCVAANLVLRADIDADADLQFQLGAMFFEETRYREAVDAFLAKRALGGIFVGIADRDRHRGETQGGQLQQSHHLDRRGVGGFGGHEAGAGRSRGDQHQARGPLPHHHPFGGDGQRRNRGGRATGRGIEQPAPRRPAVVSRVASASTRSTRFSIIPTVRSRTPGTVSSSSATRMVFSIRFIRRVCCWR